METEGRVYATADGFSARPTSIDKSGETCTMYNEQYKRDNPGAYPPSLWGLKHAKTGKLTRIKASRTAARTARKPTERVVAIWL